MSERTPEHIKRILDASNDKLRELGENGGAREDIMAIEIFQLGLLVPSEDAIAAFMLPNSGEDVYFGEDRENDRVIADRLMQEAQQSSILKGEQNV